MPGMAAYWATMEETRKVDSFTLREGLQLLVQAELDNRRHGRNARLLKQARFRWPIGMTYCTITPPLQTPSWTVLSILLSGSN